MSNKPLDTDESLHRVHSEKALARKVREYAYACFDDDIDKADQIWKEIRNMVQEILR